MRRLQRPRPHLAPRAPSCTSCLSPWIPPASLNSWPPAPEMCVSREVVDLLALPCHDELLTLQNRKWTVGPLNDPHRSPIDWNSGRRSAAYYLGVDCRDGSTSLDVRAK